MRSGTLPPQLRPSQTDYLVRIGSLEDGGYLVDSNDVLASETLISMGVDRDWSFEGQFRQMKRIPVQAYDGCTNTAYLLQGTGEAISTLNWRWFGRNILTALDYHLFFSGPSRRHFRQFVGSDKYAYRASHAPTISLEKLFARAKGKVYLKIDIEGAEYEILGGLIGKAPRTVGLAIEFHDCDQRMNEILSFVEHYPLTLVHIHANSFCVVGNHNVPAVLELTFSASAQKTDRPPTLPHRLDAPNDGVAEIQLSFAD